MPAWLFVLLPFQAYPEFVAHLEKLAGAIHPLLDAPPVDVPGVTSGSLRKRLAAAKTLRPIIKCGVLEMQLLFLANISFLKEKPHTQLIDICSGFFLLSRPETWRKPPRLLRDCNCTDHQGL